MWTAFEASDSITINTYRIPSLVRTSTGRLLAFCEARKDGIANTGRVGIARKYSDNAGVTWQHFATDLIVPWVDPDKYDSPTAVVKGTRIWLFYNGQNQNDGEAAIIAGTSIGGRHVYVTYSDDNGATYAAATEITSSVKPSGHTWFALGPGTAIVTSGGRIVVPYNSFDAGGLDHAGVFYSDDNGATWQLGAQTPDSGVNESTVCDLSNGNLMLNCRRTDGVFNRKVFISTDNGATWGAGVADTTLPDPSVNADLIRVGTTLIFSNPATTGIRRNIYIRKSVEPPTSWSTGYLIPESTVSAAYSNLVDMTGGRVGCLWEGSPDANNTFLFIDFAAVLISDL